MGTQLSPTTIALHWLVAAGIIVMIGLGLYIADMPRGPDKGAMIQIHKSIGVIVLFALIARAWWRLREGWPNSVATLRPWEERLSRALHWFLVIAPIFMVVSGIVRSLAYARPVNIFAMPFIPKMLDEKNVPLNETAGAIHDWLAWALMAVVALHVAGALRHHFLKRDATLARMLGLKRQHFGTREQKARS